MIKLLPIFLVLLLVAASLASEKEDVSTEKESYNSDGGMRVVQEGRNIAAWQGITSTPSFHALLLKSVGNAHSSLCHSPFSSKGRQGCGGDDRVEQRVNQRLRKDSENIGIKTYLGVPVEKLRLLGMRKIQCGMLDGKCSSRRKRDVGKENRTVDESVAVGSNSSENNGTKGDELPELEREETKGEELPEPEALAWIDPGRLASQGVTMEHVPSLANLMGLRVVKYKTQQPQHFQAPYRPQLPPGQPPNRNQPVPAVTTNMRLNPLQKSTSRFDTGNAFGNSFHNSFDKYYKSFNQQEMQDIDRISNNHGRIPVETSSYSDPPPRAPSAPANVPFRFPSGGVRPQPPPPNTFARPPYSSLGNTADTLMQMLNPFNLLGSNQFPQLPRYPHPVPPPSYDPRRPHGFHHPRPIDINVADLKDIPKGDIKYEVLMDPNQDLHQGYRFKEDSPLRDDLYIGQDGNLYLKDSSATSKTPEKNPFEDDEEPPNSSPPENPPSQDSHEPNPTSPSEGRYEDEDIDTFDDDFDEDFSDEYEDSSYAQLLENHNMNDQGSQEPSRPVQDFSQDYFRNGPRKPFREPPIIPSRPNLPHQVHYPNVASNPYVVRTPSNSFLNSGLFGWLFSPYSRTNYPSYYYNPREILLPRFKYPRGPYAHASNSPAGSLSNIPDANYPRSPPLSQGPLQPLPPKPPLAHPQLPNPSLMRPPVPSPPPRSLTQYPLGPLQHSPSRPHQSLQPSSSTLPNTRHHNAVQGGKTRVRANLEYGQGTGTGFYPGNGFFDSDFPTLYHMAPSQRNGFVEELPRPMGQNATALPLDDN
nr:uncharacterized protein LOC123758666 [Procambarus clarkii]